MSAHLDTDEIAVVCRDLAPTGDHAELVRAARAATGLDLRLGYVDEGWYRLGGVVDASGKRVAVDIADWAVAETGGDMTALYARHADAGLRFTRFWGHRLYLTAATGPNPLDFVQIEIDQVQEMLCRPLFEGDSIPDTVDELENLPPCPQAVPLAPAAYVYRRATTFSSMPELVAEHTGDLRLKRFVDDWAASSAARSGHFCDKWVLRVVPYRNTDGEHVLEAKPLTAIKVPEPDLQQAREHAVDYHPARDMEQMDRDAGFPMAWYFLQIARHFAHYRCIVDVRDDFAAGRPGVSPLPDRDARILESWVADPYNFH